MKYLVLKSTKKLNFFLAKYGVAKHYSPRMILHQQNLNFDKHCKYTFGKYVQAHDEPNPSNTNAARSLDCIYLHCTSNKQGRHKLWHLNTNRIIMHHCTTSIWITQQVINLIHCIAASESMPFGLKNSKQT